MEKLRATEYLKKNNLPAHQIWTSEAILKFPMLEFKSGSTSLGRTYTYNTPGGVYSSLFISNGGPLFMVPFQIDIKINNPISVAGQTISLLISNADNNAAMIYLTITGTSVDNFTTGGALTDGEILTIYYGRTKWGKYRHKTGELLTGSSNLTGKRYNFGLTVSNVALAPPITTTIELVDSGRQFTII
jgi:hypothetical protein